MGWAHLRHKRERRHEESSYYGGAWRRSRLRLICFGKRRRPAFDRRRDVQSGSHPLRRPRLPRIRMSGELQPGDGKRRVAGIGGLSGQEMLPHRGRADQLQETAVI